MRYVVLGVVIAATSTAHAGGLSRPNPISARGVGMGGAFTALADDVTALHFNPGALAFIAPELMIGGELVIAPRRYVPLLSDGTHGPAQESTPIIPLPALGVAGRFSSEGVASRFTLGIGVWNTFGGKVSYERTERAALDAVQDAVVEIVPGFAYHVDERFAIGAALRVGVGLFSVDATQMPLDSSLSAYGLGLSYSAGAVFRPIAPLRIGLTWRGPLTIRTSGTGTVEFPTGTEDVDVEHTQRWPQQLSLGVGLVPRPDVRLAAQVDWSGWSRVDVIAVEFPDNPNLDQRYPVDWNDNISLRAGGEVSVHPAVALRAGAYFDSNAVPDRTIERQYLDDQKFGVATGATLRLRAWRLDAAVDVVLPGSRTVDDNTMEVDPWPNRANKAPGDHEGWVLSFALAVGRTL